MRLTADQQAMLDGEKGWPLQIAMQMLTAVGAALDAPDMVPVTSTHLVIDGTALGAARARPPHEKRRPARTARAAAVGRRARRGAGRTRGAIFHNNAH